MDNMDELAKIILTIIVVIYVLMPIDLVPGPVDDLFIILGNIAAQKRLAS